MRALAFAFLLAAPAASAAEKLMVAAAANFVFTLDALQEEFTRAEPGIVLNVAIGSSGGLAAQIRSGAPYDVFLAADLEYPQALIDANAAVEDSLRVFATGRLVLWTTTPGLELTSIAAVVQAPAVKRLAIANVDTAPYGRAARDALAHLGLWDALQPRIVVGENVSQVAQYVESGNAQAGFVALSLVMSPRLTERGRWLEVPATWHSPLEQGVIITKRGANNPAAQRFIGFLESEAAREVLHRFGYQVP